MCHYDVEKRIDIKKFFKRKLFSNEVAEHFRNNLKEEELNSLMNYQPQLLDQNKNLKIHS